MISNPTKVKDLIRNLAHGDSGKAQLLQRRYAMERFLERMAESEYKNNLVLKGGMLVTSMLDLGQRMTRDTDVTMLDMALDVESAVKMAKAIAAIPLEDGMTFLGGCPWCGSCTVQQSEEREFYPRLRLSHQSSLLSRFSLQLYLYGLFALT